MDLPANESIQCRPYPSILILKNDTIMKKYRNLVLTLLVAMTSGCSDMLDINPTTFISDEALWEDSKLIK